MSAPALFPAAADDGPLDITSFGGGVESAAYLTEVLSDPDRYDLDPASMVVLHAVVGSEYDDTLRDCERHILPRLRDRGVRLVQLARRGPHERDGIEILDDTTRPRVMHRRGPWTLAQHNAVNGIAPQLSNRRCSLQFKGFVIDRFILTTFPGRAYSHTICYNRDERRRAESDAVYATQTRVPTHRLIDWDWSRTHCLQRLHHEFGIIWRKSACSFCPFAGSKASLPELMRRMRQYPDSAVEALLTEYRALFFNPRSKLFGTHSLHERLVEHSNRVALDRFERHLDRALWSVYDVRRLFFPRDANPAHKGPGWRSTRALFTGTRAQARQWMRSHVGTEVDDDGRMWLRRQDSAATYPKVEHFIGTCLAGTADKERGNFAKHWAAVTGEALFSLA